jgi:hypothetical protein
MATTFDSRDRLIVALAVPAWILLLISVPGASTFGSGRHPISDIPVALVSRGMTAAIHHVLRHRKLAWPLSALIAGYGTVIMLVILSLISSWQ